MLTVQAVGMLITRALGSESEIKEAQHFAYAGSCMALGCSISSGPASAATSCGAAGSSCLAWRALGASSAKMEMTSRLRRPSRASRGRSVKNRSGSTSPACSRQRARLSACASRPHDTRLLMLLATDIRTSTGWRKAIARTRLHSLTCQSISASAGGDEVRLVCSCRNRLI